MHNIPIQLPLTATWDIYKSMYVQKNCQSQYIYTHIWLFKLQILTHLTYLPFFCDTSIVHEKVMLLSIRQKENFLFSRCKHHCLLIL